MADGVGEETRRERTEFWTVCATTSPRALRAPFVRARVPYGWDSKDCWYARTRAMLAMLLEREGEMREQGTCEAYYKVIMQMEWTHNAPSTAPKAGLVLIFSMTSRVSSARALTFSVLLY